MSLKLMGLAFASEAFKDKCGDEATAAKARPCVEDALKQAGTSLDAIATAKDDIFKKICTIKDDCTDVKTCATEMAAKKDAMKSMFKPLCECTQQGVDAVKAAGCDVPPMPPRDCTAPPPEPEVDLSDIQAKVDELCAAGKAPTWEQIKALMPAPPKMDGAVKVEASASAGAGTDTTTPAVTTVKP